MIHPRCHRGPIVARKVFTPEFFAQPGSNSEVSDGHENVRCWGRSGPHFRAAGGLLLAISGSSVSCDHVFALTQTMSFELVQQDLGVNQVRRVETLGEPVVDGGEEGLGLVALLVLAPKPRKACGGAEFQ